MGYRNTSEEDINKMMSELDLNHNNTIEFVEFVKMMKNFVLNEGQNVTQMTNKLGANVFKVGSQTSSFSTFSEEERSAFVRVINTVLKNDADCAKYLPINPDSMDVFAVMKDGIILCKLINVANPGTIDERTINKKENMNIFLITVKIYFIFGNYF